jgi:hypothetical protein
MPESITLKKDITLRHQPNLGEEVAEVEIAAGTELTVLQEWERHYLAKDADGKLFNVQKELAEPA